MTLIRLAINDLRNLVAVDLLPSDRVNLIFGENGSGKTSLLEAVSLLALGRSFRSHKLKPLVNYGKASFTLFGRVQELDQPAIPIGVSRSLNGDAVFKANGVEVISAADLAAYLPVQVINSDTFSLLDGSPKVRRQLIDWLVFHVEPGFYPAWKAIQRCLKHRNSLLRHDRLDALELVPWDRELIALTEQIHRFREACMTVFSAGVTHLLKNFSELADTKLSYYKGWDKDTSFAKTLALGIDRDRKQGFTHAGSHRADLRITIHGQDVSAVLSRGQQKLLVCALKVAQGTVFSEITGRKSVYLVDDLPAELDSRYRAILTGWLEDMETQVFITGVERESLVSSWSASSQITPKLFHVEQGKVTEVRQDL